MEKSRYVRVIEGKEMTQLNTSSPRGQKCFLSPKRGDGSRSLPE